jgi:hypothetical protein
MEPVCATAEEAVELSIHDNKVVLCEDAPENREYLTIKCGDYIEADSELEFWSTIVDDGSEWRVIIKKEKREG